MQIDDNCWVALLANILPPKLVRRAFPSEVHAIHARNEAGEAHLAEQLLLLLNCGNVVEAHPGSTSNPRLPIHFTEPFLKFLVESGKS